jgi:hypothetical protein
MRPRAVPIDSASRATASCDQLSKSKVWYCSSTARAIHW